MSQDYDANVDSSATDVTEESSTSEEQTPFHEHPRFQELIEEKNSLRSELSELKSMLTQNSEPEKKEDIPDPYDDPAAFAEFVEQRTIQRYKSEQEAVQKSQQEANSVIDAQFKEIRDKFSESDGDIDEDQVGEFAIENGIMRKEGGYDLIKAYQLMRKINGAKEEAGKEVMKSINRGRSAPIAASSGTREVVAQDFSQNDLKGISMSALIEKLAKQ